MRTVTFYSYKGGVGRSLALVNVGHLLARRGRNVVLMDMDLEAPGLGFTKATGGPDAWSGPGVSDLVLGWLEGQAGNLSDCVRSVDGVPGGTVRVIPSGSRPQELARRTASIVADPDSPKAFVFQMLKRMIEEHLKPDVLLVDSRTGLADVAGVCTLELPDVVVAVCGLNEQNVSGMEHVLGAITEHAFRPTPPPLILALSPVPSREWMDQPDLPWRQLFAESAHEPAFRYLGRGSRWFEVSQRCRSAWNRLQRPVAQSFRASRRNFALREADLLHVLEHDPAVPLLDELLVDTDCALVEQHRQLADSIGSAFLGLDSEQSIESRRWNPIARVSGD